MDQWTPATVYPLMKQHLNEKGRRLYFAQEALRLGWGGITQIQRASGVSRVTITRGISEITNARVLSNRIRSIGGGRKKLSTQQPGLLEKIQQIANPKGDPMHSIRWTTKSMDNITQSLRENDYSISPASVRRILKALGFALKANKKTIEGKGANHPDRDAQFEHINQRAIKIVENNPVISIDCKKKELIGNFKNNGREWIAKHTDTKVNVYDFQSLSDGKIAPYGIYDLVHNKGFINVGIDHDTAAFSVASIKRWWDNFGKIDFPKATKLMITADGGGSNGSRTRLFKVELQKLANQTGLTILVSHYPPYTSKWNAIEHKLFSFISINWRAKPLFSLEVVLELLNHTKTKTGLQVNAMIDTRPYKTKIKVTDEELAALNIIRDDFHGEWNYTIVPQTKL